MAASEEDRFRLGLPQVYQAIDFTNEDWAQVYAAAMDGNEYLQAEGERVQSGAVDDLLLLGSSPATDAQPVRVRLLKSASLAGEEAPSADMVQIRILSSPVPKPTWQL